MSNRLSLTIAKTCFLLLCLLALPSAASETPPRSDTQAHYVVLSAKAGEPASFGTVTIGVGPSESVGGEPHTWWELQVHGGDKPETDSLFVVHALTQTQSLLRSNDTRSFARYQLHIPTTHETLEYKDVHTGRASLPPWTRFESQFVPVATASSAWNQGYPETCTLLGHVLSLRGVELHQWQPFQDTKTLSLDTQLLVGTARNFKDKEGERRADVKAQDYTYTPFTEADYTVMLKAGINLYCTTSDQEPFVRDQPVFFLRRPERKSKKKPEPVSRLPADLYRSNFLGNEMFLDEPAIIITFDEQVKGKVERTSDAVALIQARIRAAEGNSRTLERMFASDFNIGELSIANTDYPSWETLYYTAFYQMEAGLAGFVHEGRYRLDGFDEKIGRWTGRQRKHSVDEMLRYYYAFLRGGTRPFGKSWGTAIYGQADPAVAPRAVALAYDMGARYVWFWTSDHEHHLPFNEQIQLAQTLRDHASTHPRSSTAPSEGTLDVAIVIPYGCFLSLDDITWIRELDRRSTSDAAAKHRRVMQRAHEAIDEALSTGANFDITVDNGRPLIGYKRIVRISDRE